MDQDLLKQGVDTTAFWNIWRLTPEVYRTTDKQWVVKHDFDKLDEDLLADKADYVFSTTIDIMLAIHTAKKAERLQDRAKHHVTLVRENVPVYKKASTKSELFGTTPLGMTHIDTDFRVTGLEGDGPYWHVFHLEKDLWLLGYIHNGDVK